METWGGSQGGWVTQPFEGAKSLVIWPQIPNPAASQNSGLALQTPGQAEPGSESDLSLLGSDSSLGKRQCELQIEDTETPLCSQACSLGEPDTEVSASKTQTSNVNDRPGHLQQREQPGSGNSQEANRRQPRKSENLLKQEHSLPGSLHWRAGQSSHLSQITCCFNSSRGPARWGWGWCKAERKKKKKKKTTEGGNGGQGSEQGYSHLRNLVETARC